MANPACGVTKVTVFPPAARYKKYMKIYDCLRSSLFWLVFGFAGLGAGLGSARLGFGSAWLRLGSARGRLCFGSARLGLGLVRLRFGKGGIEDGIGMM